MNMQNDILSGRLFGVIKIMCVLTSPINIPDVQILVEFLLSGILHMTVKKKMQH